MRILITNDDGIHAPGLVTAEKIARAISDDVWIVAPETEQSGASHSLTLSFPLRMRKIEERRFAITGTPTDCVMMAATEIMKDNLPDLVLSGVNRGANAADDVTYSGTIAGAMEGCALGIPSIAMSQMYAPIEVAEAAANRAGQVRWEVAETHGPKVVKRLFDLGWPRDVLMNINFPDSDPDKVAGVEIVAQGKRDLQTATVDARIDGRGVPYYWIGFKRVRNTPAQGTDLSALMANKISVSPLHLNLTEHGVLADLKRRFPE